ncbi:YegP family protein [bacterium]|nr:YegP family protein [bacterium]
MAKFQIFKSEKNNEWYWHLRANNGQIIATSGEGYKNKNDCEHGIDLVKELAPEALVKEEE